ncbi:peptidyl-prolyl cis-trans isomerase 1-like [Argopecten irradians]|uniref:peptidyl-prolyl cis-trans isomerase 1-like n=1 Tax=Argopecten irradians TaxID=31199 RepID=UPI00371F3DB3
MSEEGNANSPVQMAADVPGSPVCPRKITLADFINVKRCNPHVNFNLNSRALTPHSGVTSVHGSTWDNDVQSINAEKNTPTSRRHSSRTNYSSDDDADEGQDKAQNTKRKRAVFACDGHGKRESRWKSESIRRIRLSTLIQKSRESSAKTGRASEFDPFNDSQSGYSFDMASRSTRHHPTSGDSKWSRRERASRGDTSHRRKRRQSLGESRACQTSPISFPDTDEHRPSVEEVKAQPIKEAEEEFDYPLSQLLLEYPYNPNANGVEIKTTQRATEIRSQTIDIRVPGSNSGEEKVYDANGTIIIVTASSVIDDGKMESHTEQGGNGESIHGSDQGKHDTDSRTIDKKDEHFPSSETNDHPNDKSIVNDPNPANPDSQNNALCIDGDNLETTSSSSSALIADTGDTTTYMSLSDKTLLGFSPKEHTTDRPMDECRGCPTDSSETGTNSEIAQNIGINNETSCTSNSNEAPITEKELIAENEVIKEDSGDQVSTDKEIMAECANNIENSDSVSENDKTNDSSVTFHDKNKNVDVSPNKNIHADSPPDINIQINNFDHAETPNNVSSGDTCDEMKPEEKTETNPNKERKDESLEIQADGVKGTKASSINKTFSETRGKEKEYQEPVLRKRKNARNPCYGRERIPGTRATEEKEYQEPVLRKRKNTRNPCYGRERIPGTRATEEKEYQEPVLRKRKKKEYQEPVLRKRKNTRNPCYGRERIPGTRATEEKELPGTRATEEKEYQEPVLRKRKNTRNPCYGRERIPGTRATEEKEYQEPVLRKRKNTRNPCYGRERIPGTRATEEKA